MAFGKLTVEQQRLAIQETYESIFGVEMPDEALGKDEQLEQQLDSIWDLLKKDQGKMDPYYRQNNPDSNERSRFEDELEADDRKPNSDFKTQIRTGAVESQAMFYALLENNGAEYTYDDEISPEELKAANEILDKQEAGLTAEQINGQFADAAAAQKAEADAKLAAEQAAAAKREADAEQAKLQGIQDPMIVESSLSAFMAENYDGKYEIDTSQVSLDGNIINGAEEEAMYGMMRQNKDFLDDKYVGEGKMFETRSEMRDAMYKDGYDPTPGARPEGWTAELSEFGQEAIAQMSGEYDYTTRIDVALKSGDPELMKEAQGLLKAAGVEGSDKFLIGANDPESQLATIQAAQDYFTKNGNNDVALSYAPQVADMREELGQEKAAIKSEHLPANPTVTEIVASTRDIPEYVTAYDDPRATELYDRIDQTDIDMLRGKDGASEELQSLGKLKRNIERTTEAYEDGKLAGNTASIEGRIVAMHHEFEKQFSELSEEQRAEINTHLDNKGEEAPTVDTPDATTPDSTTTPAEAAVHASVETTSGMPSHLKHDGKPAEATGQEVVNTEGGDCNWLCEIKNKVSGLMADDEAPQATEQQLAGAQVDRAAAVTPGPGLGG